MGLGIVATLAREVLLARGFGTGREIELFRLAFAIPNLLATSLGTVIVAALARHVVSDLDGDGGEVHALRTSIAASAAAGIALGLVGAVTAPWQAAIMAPGYAPDARSDLVPVIAALWLFFALIAATFGPRAFLGVRGVIWPTAASSLVLSGAMAGGIMVLLALPASTRTAISLSKIAILAAVVLVAIHLIPLPRRVLREAARSPLDVKAKSYLAYGLTTLLVLAGHLLSAVPRLIDRSAATEFKPGAVAAMDFSFAILTVPGIVFGTAVATVALPRFLAALRRDDRPAIRRLARVAVVSTILAAVTGALLSVGSRPIVELLFARGAFDSGAVDLTTRLLEWHGIALGPMVATVLLSQALLSIGYVKSFLIGSALRVVTKLVAVQVMTQNSGLDGLAASFLVPEVMSTVVFAAIIVRWYRSREATSGH